jgi:hypothetical protein
MCVIHRNTLIIFITRLLNFLVQSFVNGYTVHRTFRSTIFVYISSEFSKTDFRNDREILLSGRGGDVMQTVMEKLSW